MTSFGEIVLGFGGIALRVLALLIVIAQIYIAVSAFLKKRGIIYRVLTAAELAAGLSWFCVLLDGSFYAEWVEPPRSYPFLVDLVYESPWIAVAAINLMFIVLSALCFWHEARERRRRLSGSAIKETLDMLPVGICFAKSDGTVALKNVRMERLCAAITGKSLNDAQEFWSALEQRGEAQNSALIVPVSSGETALFQKNEIISNGKEYAQITACDISEQYRIITELRSKNEKLVELQARMKAFGAMAEQLAMSEEILKARVTVHDEMGHLLLSGKYYLDNEPAADEEKLLQMQRYTHRLLMSEGEEPEREEQNSVQNAVDFANAMGVTVGISGDIPQNAELAAIIGQAIRECAANTVKHADGDALFARISQAPGGVTAVIRSNGRPPEKPVVESGGLLMLRQTVEKHGGTMKIESSPGVVVTVELR